MNETSPYMKVRDVAEHLAVSPKHIYRLVADGALRAVRVGRVVRVSRADLLAAIERGAVVAEPASSRALKPER